MSHRNQRQPRHGPTGDQYGDQQSPSQGTTGQGAGGQMPGGQQMGGGQPPGGQQPPAGTQTQPREARSFEDHLTNELRIALEDFNELTHVATWCAKECAAEGPELRTCARICQDVAEIAELNEKLIARDSMFGPEVADLFVRVAMEGLPELQYHQQRHPHVAETVATIDRAIDSCQTVLQLVGQGGQQPAGQQMGGQTASGQQMGQPPSGQQMGGQQPSGGPPSGGQQY